jgi:hypothetical protein
MRFFRKVQAVVQPAYPLPAKLDERIGGSLSFRAACSFGTSQAIVHHLGEGAFTMLIVLGSVIRLIFSRPSVNRLISSRETVDNFDFG